MNIARYTRVLKKHSILLSLIFIGINLNAQDQTISGAGGIYETGQVKLAWNLGDCVMEGFVGTDHQISHGVVSALVNPISFPVGEGPLEIEVYPNPFDAGLTVRMNKEPEQPAEYILFDVNGKILHQNMLLYSVEELFWSNLRQGLYLLQIFDGEGQVHHVQKVVKY